MQFGPSNISPFSLSLFCVMVHCLYGVFSLLCLISLSDFTPALSLANFTANFSGNLCTFNYSYQNSCSLYPMCTSYFSVEHTVSPSSEIVDTFSGCTVEYTIQNLMRCQSYESIATTVLGNQRGNTVVVGDSVMLSE